MRLKDIIILNIFFVIIYASYFLVGVDIFMLLLFIYLIAFNAYYVYKIEKLDEELSKLIDSHFEVLINRKEKIKNEQ